jgi:ribosome-associated protein
MDDHDRADRMEPSISLNDVLKLAGLADTGGQAKTLIQGGQVKVNGEVETRRKRKVREGDVITVGNEEFTLELQDVPEEDDEDPA